MNKYLKTYIRNREILLKKEDNEYEIKDYEINYFDLKSLDISTIENLIFDNCIDPYFLYEKVGNIYYQYFNKYSNIITTFFENEDCSTEIKSKHVDLLQKNKKIISNLNDYEVITFLYYSKDVVNTANIIGEYRVGYYVKRMSSNELLDLYYNSVDHLNMDKILSLYDTGIYNIDTIDKLGFSYISRILRHSKKREETINRILNNKNIVKNMDQKTALEIIKYSKNKDNIKQIIKKYRPDLNIE
jgi:hypothetical protein